MDVSYELIDSTTPEMLDQLERLYRMAGWWDDSWEPIGITDLVKGSFAFIIATEASDDNEKAERIIGMGRAISDGCSDAYIQDITVLPDHRGKGIGSEIVKRLKDHCLDKGICWLGLVAEPGTYDFYDRIGFYKKEGFTLMLAKEMLGPAASTGEDEEAGDDENEGGGDR